MNAKNYEYTTLKPVETAQERTVFDLVLMKKWGTRQEVVLMRFDEASLARLALDVRALGLRANGRASRTYRKSLRKRFDNVGAKAWFAAARLRGSIPTEILDQQEREWFERNG